MKVSELKWLVGQERGLVVTRKSHCGTARKTARKASAQSETDTTSEVRDWLIIVKAAICSQGQTYPSGAMERAQ